MQLLECLGEIMQFSGAEAVVLKRKYQAVLVDFDTLECPICLEPLVPPVYQSFENEEFQVPSAFQAKTGISVRQLKQFSHFTEIDQRLRKCPTGDTACAACWKRIKSNQLKCPVCSKSIGNVRNITLEKILDSIQVSCKNGLHGCQKLIKYTKKIEHENEFCEYQVFHCPVQGCMHEGSTLSIPLHFMEEHQVPTLQCNVFNLETSPVLLKFTMKSIESDVMVEVRQKLFLVHRERQAHVGDKFYCACFGTHEKLLKLNVRVGNGPGGSYMMETKAHDVRRKDEWKKTFLLVPELESPNFEFHMRLTWYDF